MNSEITIKQNIEKALNNFLDDQQSLREASTTFLNTLGYYSGLVGNNEIDKPRYDRIKEAAKKTTDPCERLRIEDWEPFSQILQVRDAEINAQLTDESPRFESKAIDTELRSSYMFIAMSLAGDTYTRTQLANITRFMGMRIPQPFMIIFRYGDVLTLAIINRRSNLRDTTKQVLEKVTLIKDINLDSPRRKRAHIDILSELHLQLLIARRDVTNFDTLHDAWEEVLNTEALNKRFYRDLEEWYEWAVSACKFPDNQNKTQVIRMVTRLLFVWFLKEKNLVPEDIFKEEGARAYLKNFDFETSDYYQTILQNLFFATLNTPIDKRVFSRRNREDTRNANKYRYADLLQNGDAFLEHLKQVPFVNGGLFDSLDSFEGQRAGGVRIDCFTDNPNDRRKLHVPTQLFFEKDNGIFEIFSHYKFTVEENTPVDQEVALDPELLGQVFENLLGVYNPESETAARKTTGSYYTPRQIADYMVDEVLIAYFLQKVKPYDNDRDYLEDRLRLDLEDLLAYESQGKTGESANHLIHEDEIEPLIQAINEIEILDPAIGSGAFPMGILNKLVLILNKLDPENEHWKQRQIAQAETIPDPQSREASLAVIEEVFSEANQYNNYGRKLYLIQNCIYGVDLQPIAVTIAKLRFFISLVIEQESNGNRNENYGIRPLPNLETKLLAANTLIGVNKEAQQLLLETDPIKQKRQEIERIRYKYFSASRRDEKLGYIKQERVYREELTRLLIGEQERWMRDAEEKISEQVSKFRTEQARMEVREELEKTYGVQKAKLAVHFKEANRIAHWDPYNQNAVADFFDPEWMFGIADGFDVVIGNPPYTDSEMMTKTQPELREIYKTIYQSAKGNWDLFIVFIERGIQLQKENGVISYIVPNTLIGAAYSKALRKILLNYSILGIRDYSKVDVFKESDVYPLVFVMRKSGQKQGVSMIVMDDFDKSSISNQVSAELFYRDIFWDRFFVPENQLQVIVKCLSFPVIDPFFQIGAAATVSEAYTLKEYIQEYSDELSEKPFKKLINTGTIDRYQSLWYKKPIKYIKDNYYVPIVLDSDLRQFSERRFSQAQSRKIIIGGMNKILECVFDEGEYIAGKSTTIVLESGSMDLKYALALLNSKLVSFWFRIYYRSLALAGGYLRIGPNEIKTIPIPEVTLEQQTPVIELVDQIFAAKAADSDTDTSDLENELDELVYVLYDLTDDEKAIVKEF